MQLNGCPTKNCMWAPSPNLRSVTKVKKGWSYTSTAPCVFMTRCLITETQVRFSPYLTVVTVLLLPRPGFTSRRVADTCNLEIVWWLRFYLYLQLGSISTVLISWRCLYRISDGTRGHLDRDFLFLTANIVPRLGHRHFVINYLSVGLPSASV
jgi:hypothetical protein